MMSTHNGQDGSGRGRAELVTALAQALDHVGQALPLILVTGAADAADLVGGARATIEIVERGSRATELEPGLGASVASLAAVLGEVAAAGDLIAVAPAVADAVPGDILHAERGGVVAYCRMLAHLTQAGRSLRGLPGPVPQLLADAEAVLGDAVVGHDHELTARVLATWPLLGAPWTAPARCALDQLLAAWAAYGFLPARNGPVMASRREILLAGARPSLALAMLLALALEHGATPQPWTASEIDAAVRERLSTDGPALDGVLLISAAILRADDMTQLRTVLEIAVDCGVQADSAMAAALDALVGSGPFAARAA